MAKKKPLVLNGGTRELLQSTDKLSAKTVVAVTQAAIPTFNTEDGDIFEIVGLAQAITSMTTNMTTTASVEGELIEIIFKDNGTARAIAWGAGFASSGNVTLPSTTVLSVVLRVLFQRQTSAVWGGSDIWVCIAVA